MWIWSNCQCLPYFFFWRRLVLVVGKGESMILVHNPQITNGSHFTSPKQVTQTSKPPTVFCSSTFSICSMYLRFSLSSHVQCFFGSNGHLQTSVSPWLLTDPHQYRATIADEHPIQWWMVSTSPPSHGQFPVEKAFIPNKKRSIEVETWRNPSWTQHSQKLPKLLSSDLIHV